MDESRRCTATSKAGVQCRKAAIEGGNVCPTHGGSAPQVKRAAGIRAAQMEAHEQARRMMARAGVDADPLEHLLDSLHQAAALAHVWGEMVAALDASGDDEREDRGWMDVRHDLMGSGAAARVITMVEADPLLVQTASGNVQLHPFVVEHRYWVSERGRLAALCIKAGIAERQVRLEEQKVTAVVDALRATFDDPELGLTADQRRLGLVKAAGNLRRFEVVQGGLAS